MITDGGLNAIVGVDPRTRRVQRFPLPAGAGYANLNTATFDRRGVLWFTGQSASPMPYAVYIDERDEVWLSDFGANALGRFEPRSGRFTRVRLPSPDAEVR